MIVVDHRCAAPDRAHQLKDETETSVEAVLDPDNAVHLPLLKTTIPILETICSLPVSAIRLPVQISKSCSTSTEKFKRQKLYTTLILESLVVLLSSE